jgi:hypothetical protein
MLQDAAVRAQAIWLALLAAGCFRVPEDACAAYLERLCRCGKASCEAGRRLLPAATFLAERRGQDPAAVCRARAAALQCAGEDETRR